MQDREIKNMINRMNSQLQQFATHVGTESREYQAIHQIAHIAGFETGKKGNYEIISAGKSSIENFKGLSEEKQKEILNAVKARQTWGQQKAYYEQRVKLDGEKKSRKEVAEEIRNEILLDEFKEYELENFISEIYGFLLKNAPSGIYLDTFYKPVDPFTPLTKQEISEISEHKMHGLDIDGVRDFVDRVRKEMRNGGTQADISAEVFDDLYGLTPED